MTTMTYPRSYTPTELGEKYGLDEQEAERLIARFGPSKSELDRLLQARGRSQQHIGRDMITPVSEAAFGIR